MKNKKELSLSESDAKKVQELKDLYNSFLKKNKGKKKCKNLKNN